MRDETTHSERATEEETSRRAVLRQMAAGAAVATGTVGVGSQTAAATQSPEGGGVTEFPEPGEITIAEENFADEKLPELRESVEEMTVERLEASESMDVSTSAVDCSGSEYTSCPPPAGECNCYYECKCENYQLYRRECCCCDDDDRNGCSGWVVVSGCSGL